jgi:hypothetical protein
MRGPNKPKPGKGKSMDDLIGASLASDKKAAKKRRLSDASESSFKVQRAESEEDIRNLEIFPTTLGRRQQHSSAFHPGFISHFEGQGAFAVGSKREDVPQSLTWSAEPEAVTWSWPSKPPTRELNRSDEMTALSGLNHLSRRHMTSPSQSPSLASSISVNTANLSGFGSGYVCFFSFRLQVLTVVDRHRGIVVLALLSRSLLRNPRSRTAISLVILRKHLMSMFRLLPRHSKILLPPRCMSSNNNLPTLLVIITNPSPILQMWYPHRVLFQSLP